MKMMKKGQTATEYLIILAVVIVIALVVVVAMGRFPGIGKSAVSRSSQAYWEAQDIAITQFAFADNGTDVLKVKNNMRGTVTLNSIDLRSGTDTVALTGGSLGPGQSRDISFGTENVTCTAGDAFAYLVEMQYTDLETNAVYNVVGDAPLEGTCAN